MGLEWPIAAFGTIFWYPVTKLFAEFATVEGCGMLEFLSKIQILQTMRE